MKLQDLKFEFYVNARPEKVWDALILPEGTKRLFFGCTIESSFIVGERIAYVGPGAEGEQTVHVYGTLLAYEPSKLISFIDHPGPSYHDNHEELETRVTISLEEVGQCTKLTLVNDHWTKDHPGYANTAESWPMILSNLKTYVETGQTLDLGW